MGFKFEELRVWQKALDLTELVHEITKDFPKDELYVLSSQIKRAADSVALNIAEGSTLQSNKEFCRFLSIAFRSNIEIVSCLHIAKRRKIITEEKFGSAYKMCEKILSMISALIKKIRE